MMLNGILIFFIICSGSGFLAAYSSKRFEETIAFTVTAINLLLYVGGIAGYLKLSFWLVFLLCLVLWAFAIVSIIKSPKAFMKHFFTPGFVIFAAAFLLLLGLQQRLTLINWDEFSHWGLAAKSMYYTDKLGTSPSSQVMFKDYPPGAALFEYFWTKLSGFKEASLITAYSTAMLSMLVLGAKKITWKNWSRMFLYALLILPVPLIFFSNAYSSILIDPILAVAFAYSLASLMLESKPDMFTAIRTASALAYLLLLKSTGSLGVIFVLVFAFIDVLLSVRARQKEEVGLNHKTAVPVLLILVLLPAVTQTSWRLHLHHNNIAATFSSGAVSLESVLDSFNGNGPQYHTEVINAFVSALLNQPMTQSFVSMTFWHYTILFILLSIIVFHIIATEAARQRFKLLLAVAAAYGAVYLSLMLLMYLFVFNEYQAKVLAAFTRYVNVYSLSMLLLLLLLLFYYADREQAKGGWRMGTAAVLMCGILLAVPMGEAADEFVQTTEKHHRYVLLQDISLITENTTRKDRICLIMQHSPGKDYFFMKYLLYPRYADAYKSFSLGEKKGPDDYYTEPLTPEEWKEGLIKQGFSYVYVHHADEAFFERYGKLFKDVGLAKSKRLFRVAAPDKGYLLEAVI